MNAPPFLRVERGRLSADETAALAVALLAVLGRTGSPPAPRPHPAHWRRLERSVAFRPGHSWQLSR
ncbi:hypothetical protein Drose_24380 [Dactylosporangium roseum]|uniref:Acyl-CoA carboxylase subunit epsilon n=1 Tax=Dactylosporangium roseum TaxID=47989 RepID=A0ABY5Z0G9_9ACTN|nr:acyl-CoA carboxylase epsilon subunit [Dactylosporangium roseum]UWZ34362.1 hypothetical protein Drose_24380 [Dactylosporangium roseum]